MGSPTVPGFKLCKNYYKYILFILSLSLILETACLDHATKVSYIFKDFDKGKLTLLNVSKHENIH